MSEDLATGAAVDGWKLPMSESSIGDDGAVAKEGEEVMSGVPRLGDDDDEQGWIKSSI